MIQIKHEWKVLEFATTEQAKDFLVSLEPYNSHVTILEKTPSGITISKFVSVLDGRLYETYGDKKELDFDQVLTEANN